MGKHWEEMEQKHMDNTDFIHVLGKQTVAFLHSFSCIINPLNILDKNCLRDWFGGLAGYGIVESCPEFWKY
jgi:hypothetical protein